MYAFEHLRATDPADAVAKFSQADDARYLAGGQTLLAAMKLRLAAPACLIDLQRIAALRGIAADTAALTVGAMATHAEVAASPVVCDTIPALAKLAAGIGDPMVRNVGTLGGSVANDDPAADYPAAVLALDAAVHTDRRVIAADAFFTGLYETALAPGELITAVRFPIPQQAAYVKFPNPASRYALVGVFVARHAAGVRVAVTGAGASGVFRVPAFEAALAARFAPDAIDGLGVDPAALASDLHASAEYRAHLVGVIARRAVAAALA
ncbi:MAG: FAD binding domain-containing protein [Burkholderiales bacterium]|jgi:carbon-monoxide dehydrogenase medium subunit|nr:FAD binding domain-containing protein [Burkholderiales bacterium]